MRVEVMGVVAMRVSKIGVVPMRFIEESCNNGSCSNKSCRNGSCKNNIISSLNMPKIIID